MKCYRALLFSCFLAIALHQGAADVHVGRQISFPPIGGSSTDGGGSATNTGTTSQQEETTRTTEPETPTTTAPTTTENTNTNPNTNTGQVTPTQPSQPANTPSQTNGNASPPAQTSGGQETPSNQPTQTQAPQTSASVSTDAAGEEVTVIVTESSPASGTDTTTGTAASASSSSSTEDDDSGLSTGSIIGLSVAGGVAVLGIIAFFIWKFTRKRFNDYDHDEAIKWPELNSHNSGTGTDSHPLPVNNTGRAGFDTGSDVSLSRTPSLNTNNYSTQEIHDPYAVPPLPHMNPNQPYRDDPTAAGGYYDPYRGPVPNTLHDDWNHGGEAIPMTQMAAPGRASPAPGLGVYDNRVATPMGRSTSPGPGMAYGGPQMGRTSPGPSLAYGRTSPGPQMAYGPR